MGLVGGEKLLVSVKVLLLEVSPQFLDVFSKASHFLANEVRWARSVLSFMDLVSPLDMIKLDMRFRFRS